MNTSSHIRNKLIVWTGSAPSVFLKCPALQGKPSPFLCTSHTYGCTSFICITNRGHRQSYTYSRKEYHSFLGFLNERLHVSVLQIFVAHCIPDEGLAKPSSMALLQHSRVTLAVPSHFSSFCHISLKRGDWKWKEMLIWSTAQAYKYQQSNCSGF